MKTLKAKTVVILSLLLVMCVVASGIVACKTYKNDGTYYYYSNGNYNKSNYFKLQKDTWTNDAGESGKCKVEGNNVTLYIDFFGSQQIHASGTISDGVMCIAFMGDNYVYYCKEGKKPSSDTPDPKPNPSGETYTVTFDLNGGNGKQDSMKFEKGKVMSNLPVPTRNGYNFICWEDSFGTEYTAASVMPARNLSLTAKWQKIITNYTDEYVSLKPASQGVKDPSIKLLWGSDDVDEYVYVEITSDDIGGVERVGQKNNFNLRTIDTFEYKIKKSGYTWLWYEGDFNTPNGTQRFTLNYGSNIQLVTVSDSGGTVVKTYLVDIYLKHDYYISLYGNLFAKEPYAEVRVIENERLQVKDIPEYESNFELNSRVYYNDKKGEYVDFVYSTAITQNWSLYSTYKPATMQVELNGGTIKTDLVITPYTQYFTLPSPSRTGYDFIGWKLPSGKYITNIEGYSGVNYLSDDNYGNGKLTAEFAAKKFYYTQDTETFKTTETLPVVTYTDSTMSEILEILYVVKDTPCPVPTNVPAADGKVFTGWSRYTLNSDNKFRTTLSDYEFDGNVTAPLALAPVMTSTTDNIVALNNTTTVTETGTYRMYLPARQTYTLKVQTTGRVEFSVTCGAESAKSYTATSSNSQTITVANYYYNFGSLLVGRGYISMSVKSVTGSVSITLTGATADRKPVVVSFNLNGGSGSVPSQSVTSTAGLAYPDIPTRSGYAFTGWYAEPECRNLYNFSNAITQDLTLYAGWKQMVTSGYIGREYINAVNYNSSSSVYTVSTTGTSSSSPRYTYFTALTDGNYTLYYKNSSSSSSYGTYVYVYNVTKGTVIRSNTSCYSTSYSYVNITANAGDVIYVRNYKNNYSATFTFYVTGASYPSADGKAVGNNSVIQLTDSNSCAFGDEMSITASKNGYTLLGWYDGETKLTGELTYKFNLPAQEVSYTTKWGKTVFAKNDEDAGSLQYTNKTFTVGESVTVTAITSTGYTWVGWYNGDTKLTDELSYTFTVPQEDTTYTARWIAVSLTRNDASAGSVGGLSSAYKVGDTATITATTNKGYTFIGWYNGETKLTKDVSYTFTMPAENVTYTAKWTYYTLTTKSDNTTAGTVTTKNAVKTTVDEEVTVTATTTVGYTFIGWYNGETELTKDVSYTFTMPAENVTYTAKWIKVSLTRNNASAGSVGGLSSAYKVGDSATITATTNLGYTFVGWYNGETKLTDELSYTFNMPAENVTYTAQWEFNSELTELANFEFTSTSDTCTIIGIKDKTITEIVVPEYVTSIDDSAFNACSNIESITLPFVGTSTSATWCFKLFGCIFGSNSYTGGIATTQLLNGISFTYYIPSSLKSVTITGGSHIKYSAFSGCSNLTSVTIGNGVTSIYYGAFSGCSNLTSVTIPDSVTSIAQEVFSGCDNLQYNEYSNALYLGNASNPYVALIKAKNTSITTCTINSNTKVIANYAFSNCSKLTSVTIPDSVTTIGSSAFSGCSKLQYNEYDNALYLGNESNPYLALIKAKSTTITTCTINSNTKVIAGSAFYGCSKLTSVTIGNSVTSIGERAFYNCANLTSVTIPGSVTSIGDSAFNYCTKLNTIRYNGTVSEWKAIIKGTDWNYNVPATKVICSDGTVTL